MRGISMEKQQQQLVVANLVSESREQPIEKISSYWAQNIFRSWNENSSLREDSSIAVHLCHIACICKMQDKLPVHLTLLLSYMLHISERGRERSRDKDRDRDVLCNINHYPILNNDNVSSAFWLLSLWFLPSSPHSPTAQDIKNIPFRPLLIKPTLATLKQIKQFKTRLHLLTSNLSYGGF